MSPDPWNEGEEGTAHVCEEREGRIYHVEFLGKDHTHNWIVEDKVRERVCTIELCVLFLLLFTFLIAKTHLHHHLFFSFLIHLLLQPSFSSFFFFFLLAFGAFVWSGSFAGVNIDLAIEKMQE